MRQILFGIFGILLFAFGLIIWDEVQESKKREWQEEVMAPVPMPELVAEVEALKEEEGLPIRMVSYLESFTNAGNASVEALAEAAKEVAEVELKLEENPLARERVRKFEEAVLGEAQLEMVEGRLAENREKLEKFRERLSRAEGYIALPLHFEWETPLLKHHHLDRAGMMVGLAGLSASQHGRVGEAMDWAETNLRMGSFLGKDRISLGVLMGWTQKAIAKRVAERLILENELEVEDLRRLEEMFGDEWTAEPLRNVLRSEFAMGIETLLWREDALTRFVVQRSQEAGKSWSEEEVWHVRAGVRARKLDGRHARDVGFFITLMKKYLAADGKDFPTRLEMAAEARERVQERSQRPVPERPVYSVLALPAIWWSFQREGNAELGIRAARLGIAARLHLKVHGSQPQQAENLAPEFLDEIPGDPWSTNKLELRVENGVWGVYRPRVEVEGAPGTEVALFRL